MAVFDVIVIGTGGVGSAAVMHLARRGLKVVGIDRFPPGHDRGSSHGDTRLIRQAYFEHSDYVPLLKRAYELWADLESASGRKLYHEVGILQAGAPDGEIIPGVLRSAREHGLSVESLDAGDVARRFPGFRLQPGMAAVFEQRAGFLRVEDCVRAHAAAAVAAGAEIRTGEAVASWKASQGTVEVQTDRDTYSAKSLVIAAGAWANDLLSNLGVRFDVVRKSLYWFDVASPVYRESAGSPGFIFETPDGHFYGFPQIDELGVKVAEHTGGHPVADPLRVDQSEDPRETARVRDFLTRSMPAVGQRTTRFATCLYTLSPDRHFVVDRHPAHGNVCYAAGLSGHGFKFVSVLGEILADWAAEGSTTQPVGFLGRRRLVAS